MTQKETLGIIGKRSPEFVADAVYNDEVVRINSLDFYGRYVMFFFYEADFSFVCPTEMFALQEALPEFKKRKVEIAAVSVDSIQTHIAWLKTPRKEGGIEGVKFMVISDIKKTLSRAYYVLDETKGSPLRATFIVDPFGIVQYSSVNTVQIGRRISDLLRIIDALQFTVDHGELCPMDWKKGDKAIEFNKK